MSPGDKSMISDGRDDDFERAFAHHGLLQLRGAGECIPHYLQGLMGSCS